MYEANFFARKINRSPGKTKVATVEENVLIYMAGNTVYPRHMENMHCERIEVDDYLIRKMGKGVGFLLNF